MALTILIDFDGTCVTHGYPEIGREIGAVPVLRELVANGHRLILFTMRGDSEEGIKKFGRNGLLDAVQWFEKHDLPLYGIQKNPTQHTWTNSPKAWGDMIIDDTALGTPVIYDPTLSNGIFVHWGKIRQMLLQYGAIPGGITQIMKDERHKWYKEHTHCPVCKNNTQTHDMLDVQAFADNAFRDNKNQVNCDCGWNGVISQLK